MVLKQAVLTNQFVLKKNIYKIKFIMGENRLPVID